MSHIINNQWIEYATDNFHQALEEKNWAQANAALADMSHHGFESDATYLAKELKAAQISITKLEDMEEDAAQDFLRVTGATELAGDSEEDFAAYKNPPQKGDVTNPH